MAWSLSFLPFHSPKPVSGAIQPFVTVLLTYSWVDDTDQWKVKQNLKTLSVALVTGVILDQHWLHCWAVEPQPGLPGVTVSDCKKLEVVSVQSVSSVWVGVLSLAVWLAVGLKLIILIAPGILGGGSRGIRENIYPDLVGWWWVCFYVLTMYIYYIQNIKCIT